MKKAKQSNKRNVEYNLDYVKKNIYAIYAQKKDWKETHQNVITKKKKKKKCYYWILWKVELCVVLTLLFILIYFINFLLHVGFLSIKFLYY